MNADELADDMENGRFNDINYNKKKAADFVRQQQAEIEVLKAEIMDWISDSPYDIIPEDYFKAILKKASEK